MDISKPLWTSKTTKPGASSPVPKFVFTSSLAVFGETYVAPGVPVGAKGGVRRFFFFSNAINTQYKVEEGEFLVVFF